MKPNVIQVIVAVSIAFLTTLGLGSLCGTLFYKNYAEPSVLVAVISITSGLAGSLTTLLVGRLTSVKSDEIKIVNPPEEPVPTAPQLEKTK